MPRRDVLGLSAFWSAAAAGLTALLGMLRLPKAAVLPSPSQKFQVDLPESLAAGEPFQPAGRSVVVFRDEEGVYAISKICTHLGCVVNAQPEGFYCPCHGSQFGPNGGVTKGPAPSRLPWLQVTRIGEGAYVVDEDQTVPVGTKVEA